MGSNRSSLEFWFSLSQLSPHAAEFTRRQLLRAGGRLAPVAGALLAGRFGPMPAFAAEVKLPEITAIPAQLKGSGVVRVRSYGGAFQDAQRKAYFEPFERLSGIKVIEAQGPDPAKVKAMVDTKKRRIRIRDELYVYNAEWWADNRGKVLEKWASWLLQ
jgi:putative spermidine/putrescine transport system substrate-binding protein